MGQFSFSKSRNCINTNVGSNWLGTDIMIKIFLTILFLIATLSQGTGQRLTGMVFELGPDKKDCKIYGECDCCTSDLYFLDDQKFALMDYCESDVILMTGDYKVLMGKLTLTFKQFSVISGQDGTDENSKPYTKKNKADIKPIEFTFGKCDNGGQMLENKKFNSYKYGLRAGKTDDSKRIADLLTSDEWKLLTK